MDGGLNIPHNENRFPGWKKEEETLDSGALRAKIFGEHVASYYRTLLVGGFSFCCKLSAVYVHASVCCESVRVIVMICYLSPQSYGHMVIDNDVCTSV